jgi:hypothetical protein
MYWVRTPPLAPSVKRRGPKGYFRDSQLAYLESNLPAYNATTKGNRHNFWHKFYTGWWQRFPWKLGDGDEPPTDGLSAMAGLGSVAPGEQELKGEVEQRLNEVPQSFPVFADRR